MEALLEGFRWFRKRAYEGAHPLMPQLAKDGQSPDYFIISCIDSRSNPGTIFQPVPGTFMAHKAMGAIVRPYAKGTALAAALQFALEHNAVKEIIVLGHTGCGAIDALIKGIDAEEITSFLEVAQAGLQKAKHACGKDCGSEQLARATEEQIVIESIENLKGYPAVAKALAAEKAILRGWLFDMKGGNLFEYNNAAKKFEAITNYKDTEQNTKTRASA